LGLARLAALTTELRVALGAELTFARLTTALADLPVEGRPVLAGRRGPAFLASLPHGHVSAFVVHAFTLRGQPSLARSGDPYPAIVCACAARPTRRRIRATRKASGRPPATVNSVGPLPLSAS